MSDSTSGSTGYEGDYNTVSESSRSCVLKAVGPVAKSSRSVQTQSGPIPTTFRWRVSGSDFCHLNPCITWRFFPQLLPSFSCFHTFSFFGCYEKQGTSRHGDRWPLCISLSLCWAMAFLFSSIFRVNDESATTWINWSQAMTTVIVALVACASTRRVWHKYLVD